MEPLKKTATNIREFSHEVLVEFRKVSWPSRREVMGSTTVVIVVVLVLAVFLAAVDRALSEVVRLVFKFVSS
jgi:preprotein translocase subunit SecE